MTLQPRYLLTPGTYDVHLNDRIIIAAPAPGAVFTLNFPASSPNVFGIFSVESIAPVASATVQLVSTFGDSITISTQVVTPASVLELAADFLPLLFTAGFAQWSGDTFSPGIVRGLTGASVATGAGAAGLNAVLISGGGGNSGDDVGGNAGGVEIDAAAPGTGPLGDGQPGRIAVAETYADRVDVGKPSATDNTPVTAYATLFSRGLGSHAPKMITAGDSPFDLDFTTSDLYTTPTSVTLICDTSSGAIAVLLPDSPVIAAPAGLLALGNTFRIFNTGENDVTVAVTNASRTINGAADYVVPAGDSACIEVELVSDTEWLVTSQSFGAAGTRRTIVVTTSGTSTVQAGDLFVGSVATGTRTFALPAVTGSINSTVEFILDLDAGGTYVIDPNGTDAIVDSGETLGAGVNWTIVGPGNGTRLVITLTPQVVSGTATWQVVRQPNNAVVGLNGTSSVPAGRNAAAAGGAGFSQASAGAGGALSLFGGPGGSGTTSNGNGGPCTIDGGGAGAGVGSAGTPGPVNIATIFSTTVLSGRSDGTTVWTHRGQMQAPQIASIVQFQNSDFSAVFGTHNVVDASGATTTITATLPEITSAFQNGGVIEFKLANIGSAKTLTIEPDGSNTIDGAGSLTPLATVQASVALRATWDGSAGNWNIVSQYLS